MITIESSARSATGYQPFFDDQVYPRQGRLVSRPPEVFDNPAGSIASPPGDMAVYLRTLLNGGQGAEGRIVSAEGFRLMSTPYIKAPEFSPSASYGYGIAIDFLDGHKILRHTGGMNCFASSIHVDLDGGVAAFASINAMQGYRPTLVTQYAVQLLRAEKEAKSLPAAIVLSDATEVKTPVNTREPSATVTEGVAFQGGWHETSAAVCGRGDSFATGAGRFVSLHRAGWIFRL